MYILVIKRKYLNSNWRNFNWNDLNHKHFLSHFKHYSSLKMYEFKYKFVSYLYFNRCKQWVHDIHVLLALLTSVLMSGINISVRNSCNATLS